MANSSSPSGLGRVPAPSGSRSGSIPGRRSAEIIGGIEEEEEEEEEGGELVGGIDEDEGILANAIIDEDEDDEGKWEDADQFGPELEDPTPVTEADDDLLAPPSTLDEMSGRNASTASVPLTREALQQKNAQDEENAASEGKGKENVEAVIG